MSELNTIVNNYLIKTSRARYPELRKITSAESNRQHEIVKSRIASAMAMFLVKDIPKVDKSTPDEMRGLLYNRIRTNLGATYFPLFNKGATIRRIYLNYNQSRTDITAVRFYSSRYSSEDLSEMRFNTAFHDSEEVVVAEILHEMNALGSMRKFAIKYASSLFNSGDDVPEITPSAYADIIVPFANKNFDSRYGK